MQLIVLDGPASKPSYEVSAPSAVIGRAPDCDIVVSDQEASRHHARISLIDGRYVIEDVDAANRTVVNDRPLAGARPLQDGDLIVIGRVLFQVVAGTAPAAPQSAERTSRDTEPARPAGGSERASPARAGRPPPAAGGRATSPDAPAAAARRPRRTRTHTRPTAAATTEPAAAPDSRPGLAGPPVDSLRLAAARLSSGAQRLAQAADGLAAAGGAATARRSEAAAVRDRLGSVLSRHAELGGDPEIQRLSARLRAPVANQTDFGALWALGREATALTRAARLAHQSLALCGDLRRVLSAES